MTDNILYIMLKVDKATQTDIKLLRKPRTTTPKIIKLTKPKQQEQEYIKPLLIITFDD